MKRVMAESLDDVDVTVIGSDTQIAEIQNKDNDDVVEISSVNLHRAEKSPSDADKALAMTIFMRIQEAVASGDEQQVGDVIALLDHQPISVRWLIYHRDDTTRHRSILYAALCEPTGRLLKYVLEQSAKDPFVRVNINDASNFNHEANPKWQPTPLYVATKKQNLNIVAMLLAHGADVNARCKGKPTLYDEVSPLLISLRVPKANDVSRRITKMLLDNDADVSVVCKKSNSSITALMLATLNQPTLVEPILTRVRATNRYGIKAYVNMRDDERSSALHYATGLGNKPSIPVDISVVTSLCNAGANLYARDIHGRDVLMSCCSGLWYRSEWTPRHVFARVRDLITIFQASLMKQWQVWELVGAEVALATRWHRDQEKVENDFFDKFDWPWSDEWPCLIFWQQALSVRQHLDVDEIPAMPLPIFDSYVEPVIVETLEQLRDNWRATLEHALQVRRRHLGDECFAMSRTYHILTIYLEGMLMVDNSQMIRCYLQSLKSRPSLTDVKHMKAGGCKKALLLSWINQLVCCIGSAAMLCLKRMMQHPTAVSQNTWNDYLQVVGAAVHLTTLSYSGEFTLLAVLDNVTYCFDRLNQRQLKDLQQVVNGLVVDERSKEAYNQRVILKLLHKAITTAVNNLFVPVHFISRAASVGCVSLNPRGPKLTNKAPLLVCARLIADPLTTEEERDELRIVMEMLVDEGGAHWDAANAL